MLCIIQTSLFKNHIIYAIVNFLKLFGCRYYFISIFISGRKWLFIYLKISFPSFLILPSVIINPRSSNITIRLINSKIINQSFYRICILSGSYGLFLIELIYSSNFLRNWTASCFYRNRFSDNPAIGILLIIFFPALLH